MGQCNFLDPSRDTSLHNALNATVTCKRQLTHEDELDGAGVRITVSTLTGARWQPRSLPLRCTSCRSPAVPRRGSREQMTSRRSPGRLMDPGARKMRTRFSPTDGYGELLYRGGCARARAMWHVALTTVSRPLPSGPGGGWLTGDGLHRNGRQNQ